MMMLDLEDYFKYKKLKNIFIFQFVKNSKIEKMFNNRDSFYINNSKLYNIYFFYFYVCLNVIDKFNLLMIDRNIDYAFTHKFNTKLYPFRDKYNFILMN